MNSSIHKVMDIWVVSSFGLLYKVAINIHVQFLEDLLSFVSSKYLGMELLDHIIAVCITVSSVQSLSHVRLVAIP